MSAQQEEEKEDEQNSREEQELEDEEKYDPSNRSRIQSINNTILNQSARKINQFIICFVDLLLESLQNHLKRKL